MLVSFYAGAVQTHILKIGFQSQIIEDSLEQTFFLPLNKAAIDRIPWPISFRQVPPRCTASSDPKNTVEHLPVIVPRPPSLACFPLREVLMDSTPFLIRQFVSTWRCHEISPQNSDSTTRSIIILAKYSVLCINIIF